MNMELTAVLIQIEFMVVLWRNSLLVLISTYVMESVCRFNDNTSPETSLHNILFSPIFRQLLSSSPTRYAGPALRRSDIWGLHSPFVVCEST